MNESRTVEPCGCIVTTKPGHVHTKLCAEHKRMLFAPATRPDDNGDLVGDNSDLVG